MTDDFFNTRVARRTFVQGLGAGGILAGFGGWSALSNAENKVKTPVLKGKVFNLVIEEMLVNYTGSLQTATAINGSVPGPTLVWQEGETITLNVTNKLTESTSIHWHGIILPYQMDGVPGVSFKGIAPGETFTYTFTVKQFGTYWYHSHSGFQEMTGMYGAIVILPAATDDIIADRDYVVHLADWTDKDPMTVLSKIKAQGDYYNYNQPTIRDFFHDASKLGLSTAMRKRQPWQQQRMSPTDLADLSSTTLTYVMNCTTQTGNWTGFFKPGEQIRLRFINGAGNTFYDIRIPGLKMTLVQVDGISVEKVTVDEFRFGPGETYDFIVEPKDDIYTIFAQSMERTGYARGTLAVTHGLDAPVPRMDEPVWLTMGDMGMSMGEMEMSSKGGMGGMDMSDAKGTGDMQGTSNMSAGSMDHAKMRMDSAMKSTGHRGRTKSKPSTVVRHASSETGPSVDMRVDTPRTNLDDPGIGLRDNGRRVLTLADIRTRGGRIDKREPVRELEFHLTGNMERYSWSYDGIEFGDSTPVHLRNDERVRIILHNDTMMTHPMHLHGMWSDQETDQGEFMARRHTIPVQSAQRVSCLVTPHDLGRWAWHCHLLFHMDMGMFREVVVT